MLIVASYINKLNNLFEPNQSNQNFPRPVNIPYAIYEFPPAVYENLYAVSDPYLYPHYLNNEFNETFGEKTNKWQPFRNLKKKIKSFFTHKTNNNNMFQNSNILKYKHHLQGKVLINTYKLNVYYFLLLLNSILIRYIFMKTNRCVE